MIFGNRAKILIIRFLQLRDILRVFQSCYDTTVCRMQKARKYWHKKESWYKPVKLQLKCSYMENLENDIKVNQSIYIDQSGQQHNAIFNDFLLHVLNMLDESRCYRNCSTFITVILFKWFSSFKHVFYTYIFCTLSKIDMYGLLYILTYSLWNGNIMEKRCSYFCVTLKNHPLMFTI